METWLLSSGVIQVMGRGTVMFSMVSEHRPRKSEDEDVPFRQQASDFQ